MNWKQRYQQAHECNFKNKYPEAYADGHLQRVVNIYKGKRKLTKPDILKLRRQLFVELETAAKRNPEKNYWMELKTNNI